MSKTKIHIEQGHFRNDKNMIVKESRNNPEIYGNLRERLNKLWRVYCYTSFGKRSRRLNSDNNWYKHQKKLLIEKIMDDDFKNQMKNFDEYHNNME